MRKHKHLRDEMNHIGTNDPNIRFAIMVHDHETKQSTSIRRLQKYENNHKTFEN